MTHFYKGILVDTKPTLTLAQKVIAKRNILNKILFELRMHEIEGMPETPTQRASFSKCNINGWSDERINTTYAEFKKLFPKH